MHSTQVGPTPSGAGSDDQSLAILGCGTMGEAILGGLRRDQPNRSIHVSARRGERADELQDRYGVGTGLDNAEVARRASTVLLALKPSRLLQVLAEPKLREALKGRLVISIAAGVALAQLEELLPGSRLMRAMPNTPCLIGEGMTVMASGRGISAEDQASAASVFRGVGEVLEVEDRLMDAVTALNGSGPAFAYIVLEAIADGGVMLGLPRQKALKIAAQVFRGSASMVLDTGHHPAALKDQVTTPAGCTIAGLLAMEDGRIRSVLARAIQEAARVAAQLGEEPPARR